MGRVEFRKHYGFKGARDYFLTVAGENYDSKAIVAVAHRFLPGGPGRALRPDELSGGINDAGGKLRALGYSVASPGQNADWTWDEHVLALALYRERYPSIPGKDSAEIGELSDTLDRLGRRTGASRTEKFRNRNGVHMKLMNFRRVDPAYLAQGKVGLERGNKLEKDVWDRYADDLPALALAAAAIRIAIDDAAVSFVSDPEFETEEGAVVLRLHKARERDQAIIRRKRAEVIKGGAKLRCEVCEFDFEERYGLRGREFIEVHHTRPIASLQPGQKTRLSDLALLCSNCHRMAHRGGLLTIDELRSLLDEGSAPA
ncbi:MAG: HNH endonuclease [Brevundimonas sp.]|nr:MAG: HNH endonuclease [Brevundimonas sp.]